MEKLEGPQGIECYRVKHESGSEVIIARHGGHAISWKTADGREQLYLSPVANYAPGKAIRGGVPIIFPQFSDHGPYGRHGFARKSEWDLTSNGESLALSTSLATREEWPFDFKLELGFALTAESLTMSLSIQNPGDASFEFHVAFHTYLLVNEVTEVSVSGLEHREFLNEASREMEPGEPSTITFGQEIDRAYFRAGSNEITLADKKERRLVKATGFPDVVVWNPGPDHGISDLPGDGWRHFVCLESALTETRHSLAPGATWRGTQTIRASSAP